MLHFSSFLTPTSRVFGDLLDLIVELLTGGDSTARAHFYGVSAAIIFPIATTIFCLIDLKTRRPKGIDKLLAILGYIIIGIGMSAFFLLGGYGQTIPAVILFISLIIFCISETLIYKFIHRHDKKSPKQKSARKPHRKPLISSNTSTPPNFNDPHHSLNSPKPHKKK